MKSASQLTVLGLILTTGATLISPAIASADGLQQSKNLWRNIATGAAVLAGVGIANHNSTETTIGAIGTVVGLSQYEQARQEQSQQQNGWCGNSNGYSNDQTTVTIGLQDGRSNFRGDDRDSRDRGQSPDRTQNDRSERDNR